MRRRPALRADEDVAIAILDAHQGVLRIAPVLLLLKPASPLQHETLADVSIGSLDLTACAVGCLWLSSRSAAERSLRLARDYEDDVGRARLEIQVFKREHQ